MAGLKELRTRIGSIKSTQKITSAMKMVAAARLRRAQELLAKSQTYSEGLLTIAGRLYKEFKLEEINNGVIPLYPVIMQKNNNPQSYCLVVFSSDRGLCGSYNAAVLRETLKRVNELHAQNKKVGAICIGKKIGDALKRRFPDMMVKTFAGVASKGIDYKEVEKIVEPLIKGFMVKEFDVCEAIYTKFHSAISREVTLKQFLPFDLDIDINDERYDEKYENAFYEYDAAKEKIFTDVIFMLSVSDMFQMLINSQTSEHGARMTSMDNATRNAHDMIAKLTLKYNRLRQGAITTELTEIISGAEAL